MAITLNGILLPEDTYWLDEFDNSNTIANYKYTLSGKMIVTKGDKKTRSMTLQSTWVDKTTLDSIIADYEAFNGAEFSVVFGGVTYSCIYRIWEEVPIEVTPVLERPTYDATDRFDVIIKLEIIKDNQVAVY